MASILLYPEPMKKNISAPHAFLLGEIKKTVLTELARALYSNGMLDTYRCKVLHLSVLYNTLLGLGVKMPMFMLRSRLVQRLLDFFFSHEDERFYVNEISRRVGLDKRNLVKKLKELEKSGFFIVETVGNLKFYSLNRKFPLYNEYKKIVQQLFGLERRLKTGLNEIGGIDRAFIYGSYAANKTDASSDIDVLIVGDHSTIEVQKFIALLQKDYDREINIISMGEEEFKGKQDDPFIENILHEEKIELI